MIPATEDFLEVLMRHFSRAAGKIIEQKVGPVISMIYSQKVDVRVWFQRREVGVCRRWLVFDGSDLEVLYNGHAIVAFGIRCRSI